MGFIPNPEIEKLLAQIKELEVENHQLKGALGYPVPGDIPEGPFKCGLCTAKEMENLRLRGRIEGLERAITISSGLR